MKRSLISILAIASVFSITFLSTSSDARVGSGRTFGNRGSRGFSSPYTTRSTPSRSYDSPSYSRPAQPQPMQPQAPSYSPAWKAPSMLRSLGAGLAGGFLGSMLFRSLGGGSGFGMGYPHAGGGIGPLEIALLAGLAFLIFKLMSNRSQSPATYPSSSSSDNGAEDLMRRVKGTGWNEPSFDNSRNFDRDGDAQAIPSEQALDLFFQIQGAWRNRDVSNIRHLLDDDARQYLEEEITRLKANRRINCLDNIAVRNSEVVEAWNEPGKSFATVRIAANLLDYTIDEKTQEVIEGNKFIPVKFEEFWTFSKDSQGSQWRLSAIQQS
jgi:predicted lipid-binding transport protein (Tim44 family)